MKELSTDKLKAYLFHVRDLEALCYKHQLYLGYLKNQLYYAQNPRMIAQSSQKTAKYDYTLIPSLAAFGILAGPIMGFLLLLINDELGIDIIFKGFYRGPIAGALIGLVLSVWINIGEKNRIEKENIEIKDRNANVIIKNQNAVEVASKKVALINFEIEKCQNEYNKTINLLEQYYNKNIVYSKYRGLVPITMFCEYFDSGRCNTLTGHEGAYNIYENELRLNLIVTKLDEIIKRLDKIEQNQYMLAHLINDSRTEIQSLSNAASIQIQNLQNIEDNTLSAAYYSKISAINTSCLTWLTYLRNNS